MSSYSQAIAIKTEIINEFVAQMGTGGKLSTVKAIGPTAFPESGVYPYVGVELIKSTEEFVANHKIRANFTFAISISVKSTTLLQDAYTARDAIIDDGTGNGVQPLLRSAMYGLFAGLVEKSEIGSTILLSNVEGDKSGALTNFFADAVIMLETYQTLTV